MRLYRIDEVIQYLLKQKSPGKIAGAKFILVSNPRT